MGHRYTFDGCGINDATDIYARRIATLDRNALTADEVRKHGLTLAAAPDMLEALKYALDCVERGDVSDMQPVRDAIEIAEGR